MRFGLDIAQQRLEWDEIARRAMVAEDLGFDGAWGFDHFQPMYGEGPGPCFEGMTTLAALSGLTSRVRLGLLVTGNTYRPPALLAAEAITIDHASHGRLELSLGAAWFEHEHRALGWEFPGVGERMDRLEEALQIVRGLLTTDGVTFEGEHYQLRDATLLPRPVQTPSIPIWVGGGGERRTIPIAARYADMWHSFSGVAEMARKSALLDRLAEEAGRDPSSIGRAASLSLDPPLDDVRRKVEEWTDAGFDYLVVGWPGEGQRAVEAFAEVCIAR